MFLHKIGNITGCVAGVFGVKNAAHNATNRRLVELEMLLFQHLTQNQAGFCNSCRLLHTKATTSQQKLFFFLSKCIMHVILFGMQVVH